MSYTAQNLISQLPLGVVASISGLRLVDVTYTSDGAQVIVNGGGSNNDGGQASFIFQGVGTGLDDGRTIIATPTTGRWVITDYSGLSTAPYVTSSYSGAGENFIVLSGAGSSTLIYTLAPSYTSIPDKLTIKLIGTGQVRIQATGNDLLFDISAAAAFAQSITTQSGGQAYTFQPTYNAFTQSGVYYRVS